MKTRIGNLVIVAGLAGGVLALGPALLAAEPEQAGSASAVVTPVGGPEVIVITPGPSLSTSRWHSRGLGHHPYVGRPGYSHWSRGRSSPWGVRRYGQISPRTGRPYYGTTPRRYGNRVYPGDPGYRYYSHRGRYDYGSPYGGHGYRGHGFGGHGHHGHRSRGHYQPYFGRDSVRGHTYGYHR